MGKITQGSGGQSSDSVWEMLEGTVRERVQEFIQQVLEEEMTEFLGGRAKSQRRASVPGEPRGYRNGYGKPRTLTLSSGAVTVRRPRVRECGGAVRESGVAALWAPHAGGCRTGVPALSARLGGGGFRAGTAGAAGRWGAALEVDDAPAPVEVGCAAR